MHGFSHSPHLVSAQVEELREDADRRWQHWVGDARERMRAAELLRASVVEGARETQGLGQNQRELALQMERCAPGSCSMNKATIRFFNFCVSLISYNSHHNSRAQSREMCRRRGANSGQKTKRGIEGEDPAAAGIGRIFALKGPR